MQYFFAKYATSLLLAAAIACSATQSESLKGHQIEEIAVAGLNLSIYLPPEYHENGAYPVVYFNDGQTLFGAKEQSWALQEILDKLIRKKQIQPVIVVGIHSGSNRTSGYVPYRDEWIQKNWGDYSPYAKQYTEKLIELVIPHIDSVYATIPDKSSRSVMGASLGGLQATWAVLHYPEHFSMAGAFSPSYWVADYKIFEDAKKAKSDQKFYFDIGTAEWNYYVPMISALNLIYGEHVFYYEVPGGRHIQADWATRVHNALLIFFGTFKDESYSWDVEIEVIKSQSQANVFYQRLNPIIRYKNGLTYSLSLTANYELVNKEDGIVKEDGRFEFVKAKDLEVIVTYKGESKEIILDYKALERRKKE